MNECEELSVTIAEYPNSSSEKKKEGWRDDEAERERENKRDRGESEGG